MAYAIRFDDGERPMVFYRGPDEAMKALRASKRDGEVGVMVAGRWTKIKNPFVPMHNRATKKKEPIRVGSRIIRG